MNSPSLETFSEKIAKALSHISTAEFPVYLHELLDSLLSFSNLFLLRFNAGCRPEEMYCWVPEDNLNQLYRHNYLGLSYQLDPYYQLSNQAFENGVSTIRQIAPDRFFMSEYYKTYYLKAKMGDEIGFLTRVNNKTVIHLSIGRLEFQKKFNKRELQRIKQHEHLICVLLKMYCQLTQVTPDENNSSEWAIPIKQRLKDWCEANIDCHLTDREAQIAELILQGHSSMSAGLVLDIATETVKVHRKNLYRKLKVGSQAQLFSRLTSLIIDVS